MARICENCGKKAVIGKSQQHRRGVAGKRWKNRVTPTQRVFKVNLQKATVMKNGKETQMKLCSKCIKRFKKDHLLKSQQVSVESASL